MPRRSRGRKELRYLVRDLFGRYAGTVRDPGLKWANPFYSKRKISTRIRNFESNKLKVNQEEMKNLTRRGAEEGS